MHPDFRQMGLSGFRTMKSPDFRQIWILDVWILDARLSETHCICTLPWMSCCDPSTSNVRRSHGIDNFVGNFGEIPIVAISCWSCHLKERTKKKLLPSVQDHTKRGRGAGGSSSRLGFCCIWYGKFGCLKEKNIINSNWSQFLQASFHNFWN